MGEKRIPMRALRRVLICDDCGGEMKHNGMMLASSPPLYPHDCSNCGRHENARFATGSIAYEDAPCLTAL